MFTHMLLVSGFVARCESAYNLAGDEHVKLHSRMPRCLRESTHYAAIVAG